MSRPQEHVYTPSELNREVRLHLEMGFPRVLIEAEISNLSRPPSGHFYFSLKDQRAEVRCALFRSSARALSMRPQNGMKVLARGRISLYEPRGDFQLIVDSLSDAGEGALMRQFEELKKKLETEGLFDPAHKRNLPPYPRRIGIITSPTGAAIRDMVHILSRRWPLAEVRLYPATVQGADAPRALVSALAAANRHRWADLLIIGRGGGSPEDLAAFNDETLAREVFASGLPIISAVGHETDFSICDFVADLRAPTPSAAAELATPDVSSLRRNFEQMERALKGRMRNRMQHASQRLDHLAHRLQQTHPSRRLERQQAQLRQLSRSLHRAILGILETRGARAVAIERRLNPHDPRKRLPEYRRRLLALRLSLQRLTAGQIRERRKSLAERVRTLNAVSPLATVARGFAVVTRPSGQEVISSISQLKTSDRVMTRLKDGRFVSVVESLDDDTIEPG